MASEIHRLWAHAGWADLRILAALQQSGGEPAEALSEFGHVLGTAETWLARLEQRSPRLAIWPGPALADLDAQIALVHAGYEAYLKALAPGAFSWMVGYTNSAGQSFTNAVGEILLHAALHGQYHRGKVNLLLRQAGMEPAPTDYIAYIRGVPAATTPPPR